MQTIPSSKPAQDAWRNVFGPATENASSAMQTWTQGQLHLSLSEVRELPLEELSDALQLGDTMSVMVVLDVVGAYRGQLILQLEEDSAWRLVACLLGRPVNPLDAWGQLEMSALAETGNILASAYLNRITLLTGCRLMPAPPVVVQDYAAGILESAVIAQAIEGDEILFCRTQFHFDGAPLDWNVFFVPAPELLTLLRGCAKSIPTVPVNDT